MLLRTALFDRGSIISIQLLIATVALFTMLRRHAASNGFDSETPAPRGPHAAAHKDQLGQADADRLFDNAHCYKLVQGV
jgi:hypothetical protein